MAAPVNVGLTERGEMSEMKMMEEEMSRFEQEILTRRDGNAKSRGFTTVPPSNAASTTALVPPGIPQALSVLGTPDPSLMNLYFPPPPPEATPLPHHALPRSAQPEPPGSYDPIPTKEMAFSAPVIPTPVPSGVTSSTPVMTRHGTYQAPGSENPTLGQSEPSPLQLAAQQFAAESQQMRASGVVMPPAPRPSFVPHQVRARAPIPTNHRPPFNQHMHRPRMQHMYPVPPRGSMRGPMIPQGFPMMPRHAMGGQRPPAVISAGPTTYSAKPVRFSKTKKVQKTEVSTLSQTAVATTTKQPEYSVNPTPYTQPAIAQQQAAMQMFTATAAHQPAAAVNYNTMGQQQQQQQQQPEAAAGSSDQQKKKDKKKKFVRTAASTMWEDESLAEWDQNDFRIFCGDIGNEVTDELLTKVFGRYPSFIKAKVVRDKRTNKTKGYGFVSFKDPNDFVQAMREWNGKYVGNRPIKLRKSTWKDRNLDTFKKKQKEKQKLGLK